MSRMKDRPTDIDESVLAPTLGAWGIEPVTLTHAPVGFGDHHWVAAGAEGRRTFVTVADLAHKPHCGRDAAEAWTGLSRAMDTAATLESALGDALGEAALVAPLRTGDGETLLRLTDRYAVSVFPYVDAPTGHFGLVLDPGARRSLVERLAQLHSTQAPLTTPVHQPGLPGRSVIEEALTDPRRFRAESGPYAQRCQALLTTNYAALRAVLEHFDSGTAQLAFDASTAATVVTHGEPHAYNILDPGAARSWSTGTPSLSRRRSATSGWPPTPRRTWPATPNSPATTRIRPCSRTTNSVGPWTTWLPHSTSSARGTRTRPTRDRRGTVWSTR